MRSARPFAFLAVLLLVSGCGGTVAIKAPKINQPSHMIGAADIQFQRIWKRDIKPYVDQQPCVPMVRVVGCADPEVKAALLDIKKQANDALDAAWALYREGKSPQGKLDFMDKLRQTVLDRLNKAIIEQQRKKGA